MMFGFIFNITIVSALINIFVSIKVPQILTSVTVFLIPAAAVAGIIVLSRIRVVHAWIDRKIEAAAARLSGSEGVNRILIMEQVGDGCIAQVTINTVPEVLAGKTLGESGIRTKHNLLILLLERRHEKPEPPVAASVFEPGDRLMVFGEYREICKAFDAREYFADPGEELEQ